jgi:transcriptional regulator
VRHNPHHAVDDPDVVRQLIRDHPWAIFISRRDDDLVASHDPIVLDESSDELAVFSHVGRPDETIHDFGQREVLLIVQGRNGYVSPSWYAPGAIRVPTWNFTAAHCYGIPQVLDEQENLASLARLVEHFERHVDKPALLDPAWARPLARGTVGIRLPITRFVCKVKLSQDKDPLTQRQVMSALRAPGPFQNLGLAEDVARALENVDE